MPVVSWNLNQVAPLVKLQQKDRLIINVRVATEVLCKYKFQGVRKVVAWTANCIAKENDKIATAVDLNQDAKKRRKNTSDSTDSSKRQHK